jgi:hypothetical protein
LGPAARPLLRERPPPSPSGAPASMGRAFVSENLFLEIVYADITQGSAKAP